MTTIGHSLTGLSLAALTLPRGLSRRRYLLLAAAYVFFANLPDYPLPGWGHAAYNVSHSVFVTLALAAVIAPLTTWRRLPGHVTPGIAAGWTAAWLSHMVLDSMYSHGNGIGIFWPFSDAHLVLTVPWFDTVSLPARSPHNLRVFAIETAVFGLALVVALALRRTVRRR